MLLLLFHLGSELYAIESSQVIEIIPTVNLRPLHHVPDYVAGLFNYRGKFIPVIDLSQLLQATPCHLCLSTRIIIVNTFFSTVGEILAGEVGIKLNLTNGTATAGSDDDNTPITVNLANGETNKTVNIPDENDIILQA
jgi:chemotaxis-related protein WspB